MSVDLVLDNFVILQKEKFAENENFFPNCLQVILLCCIFAHVFEKVERCGSPNFPILNIIAVLTP